MRRSRHILIRTVSSCNPDGCGSVTKTEFVDVVIEWPDDVPVTLKGYYDLYGEWRVSPEIKEREATDETPA